MRGRTEDPGPINSWLVAVIACWYCVRLTVLPNTASWVRSSSEEIFSGRRDFPLELTWVLTLSPITLSDESINRGLV